MKIAVFVHSYCLNSEGKRPTNMAIVAIEIAVNLALEKLADYLIVAAAYDTAKHECDIYTQYAIRMGVAKENIHALLGIRNSYDEAERAIALAEKLRVNKLIVVAESWHLPRSKKAFQKRLPEGMELEMCEFHLPSIDYERTLEPSKIKSWRAKYEWSWILWNKLLEHLPTSFLQKISGKMDK